MPPVVSPSGVPLVGYVLRKGDRVPLGGIVVLLDPDGQETVTDAAGRFEFVDLVPGAHTIGLRGGDISPVDAPVTLSAGKRTEATFYVTAKDRYVSTVRGSRAVVQTVEHSLTQEEIKRIPGTQGDTLKAVQNLPGVARAPFGLGQLIVWGSMPQDTRAYVDGVYIPTLYHFGGLRSTVNSEMVQSMAFTPGAYGAERGLGLGGLVDVATRRPRTDGYHGFVQLDLIDGSLMLEGPIGKKASFAVSLRRSWIDAFLPLFTRNSSFQLSPAYWDFQAKLSYKPTPRDDIDLFAFGSDDTVTVGSGSENPALNTQFGSHTYYYRGVLSWLHRFEEGATLSLTTSAGYDVPFQVRSLLPGGTITSTDVGLVSYTLRAVTRIPLASFLRLDGGVDYEGNYFRVDQTTSLGPGVEASASLGIPNNLTLYTNHVAPYVSAPLSIFNGRLSFTPQLRLQVLSFLGYPGTTEQFSSTFVRPEPRFLFRVQALSWLAVKGAFGLFHQPPQPQHLSRLTGNPELRPQWGLHYVLGAEFQPMPSLTISAEGFYKDLRELVVRGQQATDPLYVNQGLGRVYGGELMVRLQAWRNLFGWVSYTALRSERRDHPDEPWRIFEYDQTHILTLLGSYKLPRGFQVGLRFRYVSGNPYTPVLGAYFDANSDVYRPIQGALYSDRLSGFHQLDLRADKTWTFDRWRLSVYLDIQNVYYAANPEAVLYNFDYTQQNTLNGLPILPVFGIRGDF